MAKEIWKDIPGYEGYYQASTLGRIKSIRNNLILKLGVNNWGYCFFITNINGVRTIPKVSRCIMRTFVGRSHLQVDHINGIKSDNRLCNLRYCTPFENSSLYRRGETATNIRNILLNKGLFWFKLKYNKNVYEGVHHKKIEDSMMDLISLYYAFPELQPILSRHDIIKRHLLINM